MGRARADPPPVEEDRLSAPHAVGDTLDRVLEDEATPRSITVDHGTEFQLRALQVWAYRRGVQLDFIRPGKPVENAFIESFNGRPRDLVTGPTSIPAESRYAVST